MSAENGPFFTNSIHEAVKHPCWTEEERKGLIERHQQRQLRKLARDAQRAAWGLGGDDD